MIQTEVIAPDALKIIAPEKLKTSDFNQVAPLLESIIQRHGKVRLLIDASHLQGWENISAFEAHASFVKTHQAKVERIAVIAPYEWQRWLVGAVRVFVHPEARAFETGQESEALQWLLG